MSSKKSIYQAFDGKDVLDSAVETRRIQKMVCYNNGTYRLWKHQPQVAVERPKVSYNYELGIGKPSGSKPQNEPLPMAAVTLSQKQLSAIRKLYPYFPLDELYNLVLIDCPWQYQTERFKPSYEVLSQKELKLLPIRQITKDNSILLLWTTGPMKVKALELIKHWGFSYQTSMFVWHKVRNGTSQSLHGAFSESSTEELLVATRGQIAQYLNQEARVQQYQPAPATKHSEKPRQIMQAIERKFNLDKMKSLEIFARHRTLPQFDLYGDELQPRFQPAIDQRDKKIQTMVEAGLLSQAIPHKHGMYHFKKYVPTLKVERPALFNSLELSSDQKEERVDKIMKTVQVKVDTILVDKITNKLKGIIHNYIQIFAFDKSEFGLTDILQHTIDLERDAKPYHRAPYRVSRMEEEFIEKEIQMLSSLNCIEESISDWASPIVLVKKANGELRMCIDFRGLNKVTIRDQFPLPRIDQILHIVCQGKVFSKLDLKSGFWQISVYHKDRPKTSFTSHMGTYQWLRMPFGLTNAPATFQRLMTKVLREFINKFVVVYIDDIIIFSRTEEEHLKHIELIFKALEEANLRLGFDKCTFFQKQIDILGHTISNGQYKPLESRVQAITEIARPKDAKGIQMFLGLVNYHGQFIKNLAKLAKPLRELTKKDIPFVWGLPQEEAFNSLKAQIATNPILYIPIHGKLMILYTDFSEYGLGAVLSQEIADKQERVIEYASRVLRKHEKNYPPYKGEVLAVSWAMTKFRPYLLQAPFRLVMDNQSAVKLLEQYRSPEKLNGLQKTVLNWVLELQEFHFTPIHRPGISHNNADALSRLIRDGHDISCFELDSMDFLPQETAKILANLVEEPPLIEDLNTLFGLNWWGENPQDACIKCHQPYTKTNDILICDCCGKNIHQFCHKPAVQYIPPGPWYCNECCQLQKQLDTLDPTLDFEMIQYLSNGKLPEEFEEQDTKALIERSRDFIHENHRLFTKDGYKIIPTITERRIVLHQIHDFLGHTSASHLFDVISAELWWPTMQSDITKFHTQCIHCAQMNPKFVSNPSLHPTEKGDRPFAVIHIDLTGDLQNHVTSKKNRYLFVLVDAFSKFVQLHPIPNGKAETTAAIMWNFIVNFGTPKIVITDKGTEFQGEFAKLLKDSRIQFLTISPRNPQANGMAERTIKTVKRILRKFVQSPTQNVEWDEAASAVQLSVNTATSQSTRFSPFEIVFGRKASFPSSVVMDPPIHPHNQDVSQQEIDAYVKSLKESFKTIHPLALANIKRADDRNKKYYDDRNNKQQVELKFGDYVSVQVPKVAVLGKPARGPFLFIRYLNKDKLSAQLMDPTKIERKTIDGKQFISGKTFKESTSNLALTKVNREEYDVPPELSCLQHLPIQQHHSGSCSLFNINKDNYSLSFVPVLCNFTLQKYL